MANLTAKETHGIIEGTEIVLADYSICPIESIKVGDHLLGGGTVMRIINCTKSNSYDALASLGENTLGKGLYIRGSHPIMLDNEKWILPTAKFQAIISRSPILYTIALDGADFYYAGGYRVAAAEQPRDDCKQVNDGAE